MRIPESELIINADGSIFHLHIKPEQLADKVILVGDPRAVSQLTPYLESIEAQGESREFVWATGIYEGSRITILSIGIGTSNVDIVMTELDALANIDFSTREVKPEHKSLSIVRIGTTDVIQNDIPLGSFVLSHYSIGFDGLLNWYAGREQITNLELEAAFIKHMNWAEPLPLPYFSMASQKMIDLFADATVKGMTIATPGFYGPQGRVVRQGLALPEMMKEIESFEYKDWRITNFDMECSAITGLAGHLGHDAINVFCAVSHNRVIEQNNDLKPKVTELIKLVFDRLSQD